MTRTITRLYNSFPDAQRAVSQLEGAGIPHGDISVVSHQHDHAGDTRTRGEHDNTAGEAAAKDAGTGAAIGGVVGAAGGLLAGLGLLAIPGLGPVVAAGWLASTAVGAVVGGAAVGAAGGIVGALTNAGVSKEEAEVYAEGVRRGGALVSAKVSDERVGAAEAALNSASSVDVRARGAAYRQSGWSGFDANAAPYDAEEVVRERTLYS